MQVGNTPPLYEKVLPRLFSVPTGFHIVKNLTEAFQVLLARCQAEILVETKPDEPDQSEQNKPIISMSNGYLDEGQALPTLAKANTGPQL